MRDSSSVRIDLILRQRPAVGGCGGFPPGFLPVAAVLAARAASLAHAPPTPARNAPWRAPQSSCALRQACANAPRVAPVHPVSTRRREYPPYPPPRLWPSDRRPQACNCASILPACSYDSALCRLAWRGSSCRRAQSFPFSARPSSRASNST